jgi:hypothetical protein
MTPFRMWHLPRGPLCQVTARLGVRHCHSYRLRYYSKFYLDLDRTFFYKLCLSGLLI